MKKILIPLLIAGMSLSSCGDKTSYESCNENKEISIRVNGINNSEARSRIKMIEFEISRLSSTGNPMLEFQKISRELSELVQNNTDREVGYDAHFLMARLVFEIDKSTFSQTFNLLEKCVFGYPEQEKKFGLSYDALKKISNRFLRERKLIGVSRCYELALLSSYPNKNLSSLRKNLDDILDTDIGGIPLKSSLEQMFNQDGIQTRVDCSINQDYIGNISLFEGNYIAPIPKEFGAALQSPKTELGKIKISPINPEGKIFPNLEIFDVKISKEEWNMNTLLVYKNAKLIDAGEYIDQEGERRMFNGRTEEAREQLCNQISVRLSSRGVAVEEGNIYRYIQGDKYGQKLQGIVYPLFLKKGVRIRDIFNMTEVNPYNWVYRGVNCQGTNALNGLQW